MLHGAGRRAGRSWAALDELRELSRGIHPAILTEGGLGPALRTLARRSSGGPVRAATCASDGRLPEQVEISAYYVVAEALTNAAKHARASGSLSAPGRARRVRASSSATMACGGADFTGSGLIGLKDRVEALGGRMSLHSARGEGTILRVELPLTSASSDGRVAARPSEPDACPPRRDRATPRRPRTGRPGPPPHVTAGLIWFLNCSHLSLYSARRCSRSTRQGLGIGSVLCGLGPLDLGIDIRGRAAGNRCPPAGP